jgi:hypothetical protein
LIPRPLIASLIALVVVPNGILLALFMIPPSPDGTNPPMVRQVADVTALTALAAPRPAPFATITFGRD